MTNRSSDPPPLGHPANPVKLTTEGHLAVIDEKLKTGAKAFEALRSKDDQLSTQIGVLEAQMRPKVINWRAILITGFGVAVTLAGFIWTLSWLFSERPTRDELRVGEEKTKQVIEQLRVEQRQLVEQQIEQRVELRGIGDAVENTSKKLDILIERGGARRPRPAPKPATPP